jgi:chemotaxis protein MotB
MARKKKHEDHVNHEAWAIPYADLMTLLLAFFVVMYAVSSINEGKYRVLAESIVAAFRGSPRTTSPVQLGDSSPAGTTDQGMRTSLPIGVLDPRTIHLPRGRLPEAMREEQSEPAGPAEGSGIARIAEEVREALADMIDSEEIRVRETEYWLEVEVQTDILFPTGVARISDAAQQPLQKLSNILENFPNPIRVEGHTDNVPISTDRFPSNWELSAARAASVVRLFEEQGIEPSRLAAVGYGEHFPEADNATAEGRNRNRRVLVVVLATEDTGTEIADDTEEVLAADPSAGGGESVSRERPAPLLVAPPEPAPEQQQGERSP